MPSTQVSTFQTIAPIRAAKITEAVMMSASTMPLPIVVATWRPKNRKAMKLKKAAQATASCGREHPGRDHGRDRIGGVVEAVQEIEQQGDADQRDQQRKGEMGLHQA